MRRRQSIGDVELNITAMLDMAFQLLAFFILTFRPPPLEGQLRMTLPPAQPIGGAVRPSAPPAGEKPVDRGVRNVETLVITIAGRSGGIDAISLGERSTRSIPELKRWLKEAIGGPGSPFRQIVLQVSDDLPYGDLLQVVEACTGQRFANGEKLKKLSFAAMSPGPRR